MKSYLNTKTQKGNIKNKMKKRHKTLKLPHFIVNNIPDFFSTKYSHNCKNIVNNTKPKLVTSHRSYYPSQKRVIVIGDVHGDLDALIKSLLIAKVIRLPNNEQLPPYNERTNECMYDFFHKIEWIGGNTFVVQLGDQIDRIRPVDWDENDVGIGNAIKDEGSSLHIFFLIWYLNKIAIENDGRVISVLGNHELMNIDADFRYVSPNEFSEYYNSFSEFYKKNKTNNITNATFINSLSRDNNYPDGYKERLQAFSRGDIISNFFALNYKLVVQVGKWIFMHAGLTDNICQPYSICKINNTISKYLLNYNHHNYNKVYKKVINCSSDKSPVWNREYGDCNDKDELLKSKFKNLIKDYNKTNLPYHKANNIPAAEKIAIGHTPQFHNNKMINGALDGLVWRCDVGMSHAFGNKEGNEYRQPQVLEIIDDEIINVLTSTN